MAFNHPYDYAIFNITQNNHGHALITNEALNGLFFLNEWIFI